MVTLIMPMAGRGSRFGEEYKLPKPLLDVGGFPMVVRATKNLPETGRKIFITLQEHINRHNADRLLYRFFPESQVLGIPEVTDGQATTCEMGIRHFGVAEDDPILISACDQGQIYDQEEWDRIVKDESIDVAVWTITGHPTMRAKPEAWCWLLAEGDQIKDVYCKFLPSGLNSVTTPVVTGTMFFRKAKYFLDALAENRKRNFRTNGEFYVDNVLNRCIESGLNVRTFPIDEYICWGLPSDYEVNKERTA